MGTAELTGERGKRMSASDRQSLARTLLPQRFRSFVRQRDDNRLFGGVTGRTGSPARNNGGSGNPSLRT